MTSVIRRSFLAASTSIALLAGGPALTTSAFAESARDGNGPTPFLPIQNEPAPS